jgi:L-alanine-DL-glutamate epimerase-like enolase superfamily enzyme
VKLRLHHFELPLRHVFTISRESYSVQDTLIVELSDGGVRGFGEATANPFYGASISNMAAALERLRDAIEAASVEDPVAFWEQFATPLREHPFALCALDQAAHDLWGKRRGQPVYSLWGLAMDRIPLSNYTIGIDTLERMESKLQEAPGWPIYKIKLGTSHDLDIVRALRRHTDAVFRIDANCGWGPDETIENSRVLKTLGVEFIEQPLPVGRWDDQREVHDDSALPIMADESCQVVDDVARCAGYFHGINIKLVKCGGLTPARRMIDEARRQGLRVMVGCMTESTVGISAIAQLLPLLDYVDMDGAVLLAEDIADGVRVVRGQCEFPPVPGNGVTLRRDNELSRLPNATV